MDIDEEDIFVLFVHGDDHDPAMSNDAQRERGRELRREGGKSLLAYVKGVGPLMMPKARG